MKTVLDQIYEIRRQEIIRQNHTKALKNIYEEWS